MLILLLENSKKSSWVIYNSNTSWLKENSIFIDMHASQYYSVKYVVHDLLSDDLRHDASKRDLSGWFRFILHPTGNDAAYNFK